MYIGKTPTVGNFQVCDAISVVNGQAAYTLQVGGVNVAPESANHMLVSLNGILQKPGSSFTISGSTMTFASNLATGDVIDFVQILGNVLDIGQPSDDTVTAAKLATTSITGQTAETSAADADTILIHDNSASALRKMTRSNFLSGVGGANTPYFRAISSGTTNPSNNVYTKVTFQSEDYDTGSEFDLSNDRFTPANGNTYFIQAQLTGSGSSNLQACRLRLYKNGNTTIWDAYADTYAQDSNIFSPTAAAIVTGNGSDYYEVYVQLYLDSGTPELQNRYFQGFKLIS